MDNLNIQDLILKNPWWEDKKYEIKELEWPRRSLYKELKENLQNSLILNIVGLRRTGKSTLTKQLIGEVLKSNECENIFYYLFDYETQLKSSEFLESVIKMYFDEILRRQITHLKTNVYVFLDEVQYINNWQAVLKKYYDLSGKKIKFIITGSQSLLLRKKGRESLAGRIFDFYLQPLDFKEYFLINGIDIAELPKIDLYNLPKAFFGLQKYDFKNKQKLKRESEKFIINGQFPEIKELKTDENKREYILESVLGKVLSDVMEIGNVEKPDKFKLFVFHLFRNVSSVFELENIGRELGLAKITVKRYFQFLQRAYLLEVLYRYNKSIIKQGRIPKKVYSTCTNFTCALNGYTVENFKETPEIFGSVVENVVYNFLQRQYGEQLSFYRQRQKEIDFIILNKRKKLAIEIKFSENLSLGKFKTLIKYIVDEKIPYGIVVTKNKLEKRITPDGQVIYFIPYYFMLQ